METCPAVHDAFIMTAYSRAVNAFDALLHETLLVTTLLSLPVLAAAMVVGSVIAVLQAATSIQEQSLSVLPKIGIVGMMIALGAPAGMALVMRLFHEVVGLIPAIVAGTPL